MKATRRALFLYWLFGRCGIKEGQMLPRWARVASYILIPTRFVWALISTNVYDYLRQCVRVGDGCVSLRSLEYLFLPPHPSPWVRITGKEGDRFVLVVMEVVGRPVEGMCCPPPKITPKEQAMKDFMQQVDT